MRPLDWPFLYQGIAFQTVEHYYQAMKLRMSDVEGRRAVALLASPFDAKRACRTEKLRREGRLRPDWEEVQIPVMAYGLRQKFAEGTSWRRLLILSKGPIVEWNSWHDNFWGDCTCPRCQEVEGQNHLGKLLMRMRSEALQVAIG